MSEFTSSGPVSFDGSKSNRFHKDEVGDLADVYYDDYPAQYINASVVNYDHFGQVILDTYFSRMILVPKRDLRPGEDHAIQFPFWALEPSARLAMNRETALNLARNIIVQLRVDANDVYSGIQGVNPEGKFEKGQQP